MTFLVAPIEAVSSQRSEEIEPKAGIAIAEMQGNSLQNVILSEIIMSNRCITDNYWGLVVWHKD